MKRVNVGKDTTVISNNQQITVTKPANLYFTWFGGKVVVFNNSGEDCIVTGSRQLNDGVNDVDSYTVKDGETVTFAEDNGYYATPQSTEVESIMTKMAPNIDTATVGQVLTSNGDGTSEYKDSTGGGARNIRYVYSEITADGVTDDSAVLEAELNALVEGDYFITPRGTSLITDVNMNIKDGVVLDFSATKFLQGETDVTMLLKLTNSSVIGLHIDGDRDSKTFDETLFGSNYLFKLDNNCENVTFYDTFLENATFVAAMIGDTIKNIKFIRLRCANIGEHVFYKTGYLAADKNLKNFVFEDILLHNIGINAYNLVSGHYVHFLKVTNDAPGGTGYSEDITVRNIHLDQDDVSGTTAVTIFKAYDLRNGLIDNATGDFGSLYSGEKIDGLVIKNSVAVRGCYTDSEIITYSNISLVDCVFTDFMAHVNLASKYIRCKFESYGKTSAIASNVDNALIFDNCIFNAITTWQVNHVLVDMIFIGCEFNSMLTSSNPSALMRFGFSDVTDGTYITIVTGSTDSDNSGNDNFAYLFQFVHANVRFRISSIKLTWRVQTSVQVKNAVLEDVLFDYTGGWYSTVNSDINAINKKYDNVTTGSGGYVTTGRSGDTASRPSSPPYVGYSYFDTTLGYNINWDGTNWVNGSGTTV